MCFLKQKLPGGIQIDLQFSCLLQKLFEKASLLHYSQHQVVLDFSVKDSELLHRHSDLNSAPKTGLEKIYLVKFLSG